MWTAPRTWVAGEVVTAALLNTHLRDNLKAIGDPWTAYTPTWTALTTNPTLGNGTLAGAAMTAGKLIHLRIALTFGSTTTVGSGTYLWALPAASLAPVGHPIGTLGCFDTSAASTRLGVIQVFSSTSLLRAITFDNLGVANAAPFVWATGDTINMAATLEAA